MRERQEVARSRFKTSFVVDGMAPVLAARCQRWKMTSMRRAEGSVTALVAARYLSRTARARWSRERVFFQIDELNALTAPLFYATADGQREARLVRARARATAIRRAAAWTAEATAAAAWSYLSTNLVEPEDAFGPAFLLNALLPHEPRTRALLAGLSPEVARLLEETT
jgi:hypothetical protein